MFFIIDGCNQLCGSGMCVWMRGLGYGARGCGHGTWPMEGLTEAVAAGMELREG